MSIENIILEVFESNSVQLTNLDEGFLPLNPTLAVLTLKRNMLKKLYKVKEFKTDVENAIKDPAREAKANALIAKEKVRANKGETSGIGEDATVYKLTPQQMEVLSEIHEKYGNQIIDDVMKFRSNILAPYQLIKRIVKSNKVVGSKDKFGMTHYQYKAAVESGMKKIQKRAEFFEKNGGLQQELDDIDEAIDSLRELRESFLKTGRLKEYIVNKVLRAYNLGSDMDISLDDLRKTYDELRKNDKHLNLLLAKGVDKDPISAQDIVKRNIELRKGIVKKEREKEKSDSLKEDVDNGTFDLTDDEQFKTNNGFNTALAKYMLRRQIINDLKVEGNNVYKKTYVSIIDKMVEKAIARRKEIFDKKLKTRGDIEFNDIERKIYMVKPTVLTKYSGNPDDYIRVIKDEDFVDPKYIERPKELIEAEEKIEAEIKVFERALQKTLSKEDFDKLKKYRLINNLITVGELESPDKLFKSTAEIKAEKAATTRTVPEEGEPEEQPQENEEVKKEEEKE